MSEPSSRTASLDDLKEIWTLFRETAGAVPFDLAKDADQEGLLSEIMASCTYGIAPIAVQAGKVVGAVLVRRDTFEWGLANSEAVHIAYAAVAPDQQALLPKLIASVQERGVPVIASVKSGNQGGLAEALAQAGFVQQATGPSAWGTLYTWLPPAAPAPTLH